MRGARVNDEQAVRVLLIEDDPDTLEMYRTRLEKDGYQVYVANDGEEGLARATELVPDIVFLDIRLPKLDGLEVLQRLRDQESTAIVPVVILSNYGERDLVDRGLKLGALEFLVKAHTSPVELSGGIDEWLKE
jgi:DNA-binding response OmpR family regulator